MTASTPKEKALEALQKLPADAMAEDVMEQLLFQMNVERGLAQADAGETVSHEEARRRLFSGSVAGGGIR